MTVALIWLAAAVVAMGIELVTADLTFALIAVGAAVASGATALGAPLWLQVIVGAAVAIAGIVFVRPIALRHMRRLPIGARTGVDALPGTSARALTEVTTSAGRIRLRGEEWSARLDRDVTSEPVPAGQLLVVTRIDGATALVHPIDE